MNDRLRHKIWLVAALTLTALKLWLSRGQGVYAIGGNSQEDRLFVELTQHLVRAEWLGPYNELTLAQGPFYPLFIAIAFLTGVPLFLAQQALYATACGLFVRALRPAVTRPGARLAIYTLLLWNPMTFDVPSMGRVIPQQVSTPLVLMVFAALIALYLRRTGPANRQVLWLALLGLAGSALYLTQEELLWFAPGVLLLAGACLWDSWKVSAARLGLALVIAALPVLTVCALNKNYYGCFGTRQLPAGLPSGGPPSPVARYGTGGFVHAVVESADFVVSFSRFSGRPQPSTGSTDELQLFRDLTRERLSPPKGDLDIFIGAPRYLLNLWKAEMLHRIGKALRPILLVFFCLAQVLVLFRVFRAARYRQWTYPLTVAVAAWAPCAAAILGQAAGAVSTATGPAVATFAPIYPLLLVFMVAVAWDAATAWRDRVHPGSPDR